MFWFERIKSKKPWSSYKSSQLEDKKLTLFGWRQDFWFVGRVDGAELAQVLACQVSPDSGLDLDDGVLDVIVSVQDVRVNFDRRQRSRDHAIVLRSR